MAAKSHFREVRLTVAFIYDAQFDPAAEQARRRIVQLLETVPFISLVSVSRDYRFLLGLACGLALSALAAAAWSL